MRLDEFRRTGVRYEEAKNPMRTVISIFFVLLICGCVTTPPPIGGPDEYGTYPDDYEQIVKRWINLTFLDPDSVKVLNIQRPQKQVYGEPFTRGTTYCYLIPVAVNAKNAFGGYTGREMYSLYVRNGTLLGDVNLSAPPPRFWLNQ